MKNPTASFDILKLVILDIVGYFKNELEKRGVKFYEKEYSSEEILSSISTVFQKNNGYDFGFFGKYDEKKGIITEIRIIYHPNDSNSTLRFIWTATDRKPYNPYTKYSKIENFPQEKLTEPRVLDLMAVFLKNKVMPDRKSRQDFLYKMKKATE